MWLCVFDAEPTSLKNLREKQLWSKVEKASEGKSREQWNITQDSSKTQNQGWCGQESKQGNFDLTIPARLNTPSLDRTLLEQFRIQTSPSSNLGEGIFSFSLKSSQFGCPNQQRPNLNRHLSNHQSPFCAVDVLLLSMMSFVTFPWLCWSWGIHAQALIAELSLFRHSFWHGFTGPHPLPTWPAAGLATSSAQKMPGLVTLSFHSGNHDNS